MRNQHFISLVLGLAVLLVSPADFSSSPTSPPQRISHSPQPSKYPEIALSGMGNLYIHLIWSENDLAVYRRNPNGGAPGYWESMQLLSKWGELDLAFGFPLHIAAAEDIVHAVMSWRPHAAADFEIFYKRSIDSGKTWAPWKRLTYNTGDSRRPRISCTGGRVYITWQDDNPGNFEIFMKRSINSGVSFGPAVRMSFSPGDSHFPDVCAAESHVYLIWDDSSSGNRELYFKRSGNSGSVFGPVFRLTYTPGKSWFPRICCDVSGQYLHAAWVDDSPGNDEIYHKRNTDFGSGGWSSLRRLSYTAAASWWPDIDHSGGGTLDVVWQDLNPGNWEVINKYSINQGVSWTPAHNWTSNPGGSVFPKINSFSWDLVWQDNLPGNPEIFFKN